MRLDCVISIVIITVNIINKVLLSALFLLPRLSWPNIYKYRTVPRRRRNGKRRAGRERQEGSEGAGAEGGTAEMLGTRGEGAGWTIRTEPPFAKGPRQLCPNRRRRALLAGWGPGAAVQEHGDLGTRGQGTRRRRKRPWRGRRRQSPGAASPDGFLLQGLGPGHPPGAVPCRCGCHCSDPARIPPEPSASSASSSYACGCGRWRGTAR